MKVRHRRFVEEFCIDGDKTKAAIRAGYAADCAKQTGYRLYNRPDIRIEIDKRLDTLSMTAAEAIKHDSDIARTRLNDFFIIKKVQGREMIEQYVTVLLEACEEEIEMVKEFVETHDLDDEERIPFLSRIKKLQGEALDYYIDIQRYGNEVTRLAVGKPIIMEVAELDHVALSKAKDVGRIQEYNNGPQGVKVKMYAADAALARVLKIHGKLVDQVDHSSKDGSMSPKGIQVDPETLTSEQLSLLLDVIRSNESNS